MSVMSGSEISRLVLGYIQSQRMDKVALEFSKLSPYLGEEYEFLKRGLKIKQASKPRTLIDIIREQIEIEEIVSEFIENEYARHDQVPNELLQLQSLKDKVQYACRMFGTTGGDSSQGQRVATRKRPHVSAIQSEYESDSTCNSSPQATNVEDLPGYTVPPSKRRKLYDPRLLLTNKSDIICLDDSKTEKPKSTPFKATEIFQIIQDPTSSNNLQKSASKIGSFVVGKTMSDSLLAHIGADNLAKSITDILDENISVRQLDNNNRMTSILETVTSNPTFEDIIADICISNDDEQMSSGTSRPASEPENDGTRIATNRSLHTPIPQADTNKSCGYGLRSQKKVTPAPNASVESKRKKSQKIEIISDERLLDPIEVIDSDSEGAVTTTSQQQQAQQSHAPVLYFEPQLQTWLLLKPNYDAQPSTSTASIFTNVIDQSQIAFTSDDFNGKILNLDNFTIVNSNALQQSSNQIILPGMSEADGDENRSRVIMINNEDVRKEGSMPVCQIAQAVETSQATEESNQKPGEIVADSDPKHAEATEQTVDSKTMALCQLKLITEPKIVTPKQLIKSNIPSSSRSLSTPRNRNPHVRVLDFNTPSRLRGLSEIAENKNDSTSNTSRFLSETPQNRSITSSMPTSAPPRVNSVTQSQKKPEEKLTESTAAEPFVPDCDEDTVVSAEGETPKVRKTNRKGCVRTISAHKEINSAENQKRLKRVAQTKKKICAEDGDSNESDTGKKEVKVEVKLSVSKEDAAAEWERIKNAKNNPELFEQQLREQNSKKQNLTTGRKRRSRRTARKPAARSKPAAKAVFDESTKSVDISLNSSLDPDTLNSTQTNLEARMLEENLKSAKKATPIKPVVVPKSTKKKTQVSKVQIKLMPSPKNKALRRSKSKKELNPAQASNETNKTESAAVATPTDPPITNKPTEVEAQKTNENTTDDLEVAQNLLNMQDMILKADERKKVESTEVQSSSVAQPTEAAAVAVCKTASEPMSLDKRADLALLRSVHQPNLSMSALLETPYKDGELIFPKTPCIANILSQMATPHLRPCDSLMEDSIFKNPLFPTPSFPITPGSIFTPFKNMLSPRSDQELIYGAANRPTDYSSSSSYYKPDESDGIDKQIQATIQSTRTNSAVYSADEIEDSSKIEDTTQNTMNRSSSSSSSSDSGSNSDSNSGSDSDSSSSSDSEKSHISNRSPPKASQPIEPVELLEPPLPERTDEDSTQIIKSHLVSTNQVNIAQNILLKEPETPIKSEEAIRQANLEEKRRRMAESLREVEMKNHEKTKPKQTKKVRTIADRERLRGPPVVVSPSKRKSTQPKKIVSVQSRQVYSHMVSVASETQTQTKIEVKTQSVTTERLISEASGDNAIADVSDVSTQQNRQFTEEESVEAIKCHINKSGDIGDDAQPTTTKECGVGRAKLSPEGLIDMLSEKQRRFDANRPKGKTAVIDALPMARTTRSRAKKIAPVQYIVTKGAMSTAKNANKPANLSKEKRKSKDNSVEKEVKPAKQSKTEGIKKASANSNAVAVAPKSNETFETPAKVKQARQLRDIFGDCTDIETPIKSPPKPVAKPKEVISEPSPSPSPPSQKDANKCNKFEADSSNVQDNDDNNESSEEDDEDESFEMVFSIDETDKKRFISMRENGMHKSKESAEPVSIGRKKIILDGRAIVLEPSDEIELYMQDVNSVVKMKKERRKTTKEEKADAYNEPTSSSECIYGQPLHTSTPSPSKKVMPKFNVKPKSSDNNASKTAKKQSPSEFFNDIVVDDVLVQLHPGTTE